MKKAKWYPGKNITNAKQGLQYKYYEVKYRSLPDFTKEKIIKSGTVSNFDLSNRLVDDYFAFRFTGYIDVPAKGIYTFYLASDDGSMLSIENELVVDHNGLHGPTEKRGQIALLPGKHPIVVDYFEATVGETLEVYWEGPGIEKRKVPAAYLFHL
ncbi:MAG: hypothetical protein HC831_16365 [Chloroflexia bacterium]|nr:hypothetical protein [Chloroflexia bacterium]